VTGSGIVSRRDEMRRLSAQCDAGTAGFGHGDASARRAGTVGMQQNCMAMGRTVRAQPSECSQETSAHESDDGVVAGLEHWILC
jgi:hypothetical protein